MITFIIPTIGRQTLPRTIQSLKNLQNSNWKAIVIFDAILSRLEEFETKEELEEMINRVAINIIKKK